MANIQFINTISFSDHSENELLQSCIDAENNGADALLFFIQNNQLEKNLDLIQKMHMSTTIPFYINADSIPTDSLEAYRNAGISSFVTTSKDIKDILTYQFSDDADAVILHPEFHTEEEFLQLLTILDKKESNRIGMILDCFSDFLSYRNLFELKYNLKNKNFHVNALTSTVSFPNFKLNSDGMIPVIVQDYQTNEVLMLAYMNQESFEATLRTGHMTYYSRSRQELWEKGLTSGHFQYVKDLFLDCDNDTILAKVYQVGAACHTGKRSCFFQHITTI